jgi:nucleoporin NUP42
LTLTDSAFGAKPAESTSALGTSAFGQPSAFGAAQPLTSAFGAPSQPSAFGKPAQANAFGAPAAQGSPFGQTAAAPSTSASMLSPFGQSAAQSNVSQVDYADSIPQESDISAEDLAAFKAGAFDVLRIPLVQPPLSVR